MAKRGAVWPACVLVLLPAKAAQYSPAKSGASVSDGTYTADAADPDELELSTLITELIA